MNNDIPLDTKTQDEIASLLALGILRLKMRETAANKAFVKRKALDFRANKSVPVVQENDDE
ncbi:MAG: hypothetical protein PHS57_00825 [Alphaproteobacteria bacterium]|nr:hypothetical protein [Alphaproteobacteria bacterium]